MDKISQYATQKEYIVTLHNSEDLESFYEDMETPGGGLYIPNRAIYCAERRPTSRSTHYMLSEWEAQDLKNDPRVRAVEIHPRYLGVKADVFGTTQTSTLWNKSASTSNGMRNWGLLRCFEGQDRNNWGSNGTTNQTGTINLDATGRNVDIVVIDGDGVVLGHPEYAVNEDGTGGTRFNQYNWYQHDPVVKGTQLSGNYPYNTVSGHATHVTGTVGGNTQGWARNANLYNIYYFAGADGDTNFPYVMDYVREFHKNKSVNPATGRKNPTITNNSWGMSIFPSEWSFDDITAVTYRGTRYTPEGLVTFTGFSGVCSSNTRLATLINLENGGNRITTTGSYALPGGSIVSIPPSWTQQGQQASLTVFSAPDPSYTLTVDGPADLNLIHNIAIDAVSGNLSIQGDIIIKDSSNNEVTRFSQGPDTSSNGGTVEINIRQSYNLPNDEVYTILFNTAADATDATSPLFATALSLTVVTETVPATATVTSIPSQLLGAASLTASTTPTVGDNDDGFWTLNLPFNITYLGNSYSTIYVGANTYLTFTAGSQNWSNLSATNPNLPKIMWSCADNSVQRIYFGTEGSAPNRTYRVRIEGSASRFGTVGVPSMVCEYVFYEAFPDRIDLQTGVNGRKTTGTFSTEQLNAWGLIAGQRIPKRVAALDADIEDAIDEGIIYVGAAGNGRWKHDIPGGLDWNNTFEMANRYPDSVANPYYYMRGTSPTANDVFNPNGPIGDQGYDLPNICVGSIDVTVGDQKADYSDCGPGVDIFAPGTNIISSYNSGVSDARNASFLVGKISGTSMASPQVCGVLACALENNPHWKQEQAKAYITGIAKQNQITDTTGGPADFRDLQGAPDKYLFYRKEREDTGTTVPKLAIGPRPTTGITWPRPRIHRFR